MNKSKNLISFLSLFRI